ncbi:hypothetical protein [Oryza sativa Japonica Group]|uniref:Uncharacterized protein P0408G07.9 n=1 Tax=Oryza sativa subsp. japonica TaxID=39947 RepID=Q5N8H5_ORYSJ|nr:hypothetical protein [Oryza sativa Japonica Group]
MLSTRIDSTMAHKNHRLSCLPGRRRIAGSALVGAPPQARRRRRRRDPAIRGVERGGAASRAWDPAAAAAAAAAALLGWEGEALAAAEAEEEAKRVVLRLGGRRASSLGRPHPEPTWNKPGLLMVALLLFAGDRQTDIGDDEEANGFFSYGAT